MLLPLLIPILCALLFVIFYKRPVDTSGVHANYTVPIDPPPPQQPSQSPSQTAPVAAPPPVEVPMSFNDVFGAKPAPKADRPRA
ncbi:MAG: hypothetical protein AB7T06_05920 [Kofleriaceae bacterium]